MPRRPETPPGISPKGINRFSRARGLLSGSLSGPASASGSPSFPMSNGTSFTSNVPRPIRRPKKILYLVGIFFLLYWFGIRHGLGIERIPPPPLGFAVQGGRRGRKSSLVWGGTGMATVNPFAPGKPEHPIYELMERAETRWEHLLTSQSTNLDSAVEEYKRRYHMRPPLGFDAWFAFCQENGIKIVDDYDQMMKDILPHHALPPHIFIQRMDELEGTTFTYTLDISSDSIELSGPRADKDRPKHLLRLFSGLREHLPPGFRVKVTGSDHDTGSTVLGRDQRQRAMELVKTGEHFDEAELQHLEDPNRTPAWGWFKACPLDSPANIRPGAENATDEILPKTFIYDHLPTMDFCDFPELKRLHGAMHMDWENRSPSKLKPVLVLSKFPGDSSFQTTPMEGYRNITEEDVASLGAWETKTDHRLFWRGSSTGGYNKQRDWKESHRMRLHLMFNGPKGGDKWWEQQTRDVMMPDGKGGYDVVRRWERVLSQAYADVKLAGVPVQCPSPELCKEVADTIEFGNKIWPNEAAAYRFNLDVDGNGWSQRFHRLLSSGSPVIKMTMFPEWHMGWLIPWYHYIPLKVDYSDLYDTLAFFVGPMDDNGEIDETLGHDYLAQKIGEAGQRFALDHWRWIDMQAYMFRMVLELRRLHATDRESMTYKETEVTA
nr:beta-1,2-xylosyltransferase 1 [Naematelia aurantialba]